MRSDQVLSLQCTSRRLPTHSYQYIYIYIHRRFQEEIENTAQSFLAIAPFPLFFSSRACSAGVPIFGLSSAGERRDRKDERRGIYEVATADKSKETGRGGGDEAGSS